MDALRPDPTKSVKLPPVPGKLNPENEPLNGMTVSAYAGVEASRMSKK
jgi:hypothetical protein